MLVYLMFVNKWRLGGQLYKSTNGKMYESTNVQITNVLKYKRTKVQMY